MARQGGLRLALATLTGFSALYFVLVAFGNITDFGTNQQFVRHVLAMDTTFNDPDVMWRAITNTTVADAAYIAIIAWEVLTGLVLVIGFLGWLRGAASARRVSTLG